jgi:hypothetical protein
MTIMINLLAALGGIFMGYSISLGFKPRFHQPRNLRIQVYCGLIGLAICAIVIILTTLN